MIKIRFLEDNYFHVSFNKDKKFRKRDLIKYLNVMIFKFLYCSKIDCGKGFILHYSKLEDIKKFFNNIEYENEYFKPKFYSMGMNLKLPPYDYQKEAIYSSLNSRENLLVLPCGAGKTIISIGIYLEALEREIIKGQGLIVVKASLKIQWKKEIEKFSDFSSNIIQTYSDRCVNFSNKIKSREKKLKKLDMTDPNRKALVDEINKLKKEADEHFLKQFDSSYDLLIANYETLVDERVNKALQAIKLECILCDEIHYSKTHTTDRAKALYNFNDAIIKIGATATPITKDPRDVYGIYKFIKPDIFGLISHFQKRYIKYAGVGRISGFINTSELKDKIANNIFVKTKQDVASQLPKLNVLKKTCDLTFEQSNRHQEILFELDELNQQDFLIRRKCKSESEALLNEELQKIGAKILALQTFAQEIADAPIILKQSESNMAKEYSLTNDFSPKLEMCMELIAQILESSEDDKEKICIFSRYESMQKVLTEAINKYNKNIKIAYVSGSLSAEKRYSNVYEKFKTDNDCKILLCSDAGAEGKIHAFIKSLKLTGNSLEPNLLTMHSNVV